MKGERLQGADYRFIGVCLALLAASTWFSVRYFYLAFPEASIDFRTGRAEAKSLAERFLRGRGYDTTAYRHASSFTYDDDAKTFLEREAGLEQANQIMGGRVRLWRWSNRWFRPQQKEEYRVAITPSGETAGFEHLIAENAGRPAVTEEQARAEAERFLREAMGRDIGALDFMDVATAARPARTDRVFTWKERDFNLKDATNRIEVTMLGNEVGGYREYLKVPEQWSRDYARLRSKNDAAQYADTAVIVMLAVGMVVVIVLRVRQHDMHWRRAALVGVAGMALSLCASANQFPLQEFGYPTTDSYASFVAQQMLQSAIGALAAGGLLFLITAAAEPLYREFFPGKISLGNLFLPRGLRTKSFLKGSVLGLSLCGIFIAYQTGFYIVAYRFGAWSPADVPYSDLLNTRFPWLYVLFGGFLPAVSEEFAFRMFAIPFLRKLVRYLPAAVVLAGFIWGFGHAGYPQQPFYIRGVEVGIGGVALGLIMLRWGILPTLVWHYSVDAMYTAMLLLRSPSLYFRMSGAVSAGLMVLPVAAAALAYWRSGAFAPEAGLSNHDEGTASEEPAEAAPQPVTTIAYRPLSGKIRVLAAVLCVAGVAALWAPVDRFGESPNFAIGIDQAKGAADAFVRGQGLNPETFQRVTSPATHWDGEDSLAGKYFLEHGSVKTASALFEHNRPARHWATRYFRSLDKEELLVSVHPESGKVLGFVHTIPEDRPGADLTPDAAREEAQRFAKSQGLDVAGMELKESTSELKKARRDYKLVWESRAGDGRNVEDAHFRVEAQVAGDAVVALRSYWKLPETYVRARSRQNALSNILLGLRLGGIAGLLVYGIWLLIQKIRGRAVQWGAVMRIAAPAALLIGVGPLLSLPQLLRSYHTAIPLGTFEAIAYTSIGIGVVGGFLILAAAAALITSLYPDAISALRPAGRRIFGLDAAAAALAAAGTALLLEQGRALLMSRFPAEALYSIDAPSVLASASPAVAVIAGAFRTTLLTGAALALLALLVKWKRKTAVVALGLGLLTVQLPVEIRTAGEFALQYGVALAGAAAALAFCYLFARSNLMAYVLTLWIFALRPAALDLWSSGNARLEKHGWAVAAVAAASFCFVIWPRLRQRETD